MVNGMVNRCQWYPCWVASAQPTGAALTSAGVLCAARGTQQQRRSLIRTAVDEQGIVAYSG